MNEFSFGQEKDKCLDKSDSYTNKKILLKWTFVKKALRELPKMIWHSMFVLFPPWGRLLTLLRYCEKQKISISATAPDRSLGLQDLPGRIYCKKPVIAWAQISQGIEIHWKQMELMVSLLSRSKITHAGQVPTLAFKSIFENIYNIWHFSWVCCALLRNQPAVMSLILLLQLVCCWYLPCPIWTAAPSEGTTYPLLLVYEQPRKSFCLCCTE